MTTVQGDAGESTMEKLVHSAGIQGMQMQPLTVESTITSGFAGIQLLGNAGEICRDGKERAKAALESLGFVLPSKKIVVNLSPAEGKKEASHLDLPIAISLALLSMAEPPPRKLSEWMFAGELGIGGQLKATRGIISICIEAMRRGFRGVVISAENIPDIQTLKSITQSRLSDLQVMAFENLARVLDWLNGSEISGFHLENTQDGVNTKPPPTSYKNESNFDDMVLSPELYRIATCVAAGRHNLLLRGTPGVGKSMFAARLPSIFPLMDPKTQLEALQIHGLTFGQITPSLLQGIPPFRAPHHQASAGAITGTSETPGELALAHGGILFLDEFPEFRRDILESLREPLENGHFNVIRARSRSTWLASVVLIAAANNCPCGWLDSRKHVCICPTARLLAYQARLSGPILSRIDIHYTIPESGDDLYSLLQSGDDSVPKTKDMIDEVKEAVLRASRRNVGLTSGSLDNSAIPSNRLQSALAMKESSFDFTVAKLATTFSSRRTISKILRVARTLADLDGREVADHHHIQEASNWAANGKYERETHPFRAKDPEPQLSP